MATPRGVFRFVRPIERNFDLRRRTGIVSNASLVFLVHRDRIRFYRTVLHLDHEFECGERAVGPLCFATFLFAVARIRRAVDGIRRSAHRKVDGGTVAADVDF